MSSSDSDEFLELESMQQSHADQSTDRVIPDPEPRPTEKGQQKPPQGRKDARFWATILVINIAYFLPLLETSCISTALPTIINSLHGSDFVWAGSVYNIAASAFMPTTGGLAQVFGRKPALLFSLILFSLGCILCGAAQNQETLIAGRAIQGAGGAGLFSVSTIVLSDIVPLQERGTYNGILQVTWCIAAGIGPAVGGALAQEGQWRWLFFLNLPIAGVTAVVIILFMNTKSPEGDFMKKMARMDWIGIFLVTASTCSVAIALTWGGAVFPWSSARVLAPLILGAIGFLGFLAYEGLVAKMPLIPFKILSNRTSLSGYIQTFLLQIPFPALVFYLPIYFQACKGFSPLKSGTALLPLAFSTAPASIVAGISVSKTGRYRPQLWLGWALAIPALVLIGLAGVQTPVGNIIGYEFLAGIGFGLVFSATYFPVLAPLPLTTIAPALAFFAFLRQFGQIWAITIGGSILQNELSHKLPGAVSAQFAGDSALAFGIIPELASLNLGPAVRAQVQEAFAAGLHVVWRVMAGVCGFALLSCLLMKGLPLHTSTDKNWGVQEKKKAGPLDPEASRSPSSQSAS